MIKKISEQRWAVGGRRAGLVLALAATQLAGCAPLLVGGAVVGGTMMYVDRRTAGTQVEDQSIEVKASNLA